MANPRTTRTATSGPLLAASDRPIVPSTLRVQALETEIQKTVSKRMGERLGVTPGTLPNDLKAVIASASATAAQRAVELGVTQDLAEAVGDVARGSVLDRFDTRVDLARQGLDHISNSNDVKQIMRKRAEMLAEKRRALETAGFTTQEAMDIVLADIAARGH